MDSTVSRVVIAGGGTAGWLAAATLGAWSARPGNVPLKITLVESPDIPTIGVGEGTWPTIRETLSVIGIREDELLAACDASFKQGSRFDGWRTGAADDIYYHPFAQLPPIAPAALVAAWNATGQEKSFAATWTPQPAVCDRGLAPRQATMPAYSGALNYAYHLDAAKLVDILRRHSVDRLGIRHVTDTIAGAEMDGQGGIAALSTLNNGRIEGDLFIDCTGLKALLIEEECGSGWSDMSQFLFNDRALAAQVPVEHGSAIASATIATAHEAGWLWDIGLPTRRGIGCVYASRFLDDDRARVILDKYIAAQVAGATDYAVRSIAFPTGHRTKFWSGNCVAIGLSAGFVEPLEASAIVLIELSLKALISSFPTSRERMPYLADRFNRQFTERWRRITEFLKLHYVLSKRSEAYWTAHRDEANVPSSLADLLKLWKDQPPSADDFPLAAEMFPAASFQYVYYGMGGELPRRLPPVDSNVAGVAAQVADRARGLVAVLPANRIYLDKLVSRPIFTANQESAA